MKAVTVTHKRLNRGKPTELYFDLPDTDIRSQVQEMFFFDTYNPHLKRKDLVVMDLGANIGLSALYFKDIAKVVHAFEPHPYIYKMLIHNTKECKKIKTYNYAVLNGKGMMDIGTNQQGNLSQNYFELGEFDKQKVACISFGDALKLTGEDHIDVLKIDVEGCEYIIFPSKEFVDNAHRIDVIVGESHYAGQAMPMFVPPMLKECGFETKFVELDIPNYEKNLVVNMYDGSKKKFKAVENTNFIAKRI